MTPASAVMMISDGKYPYATKIIEFFFVFTHIIYVAERYIICVHIIYYFYGNFIKIIDFTLRIIRYVS